MKPENYTDRTLDAIRWWQTIGAAVCLLILVGLSAARWGHTPVEGLAAIMYLVAACWAFFGTTRSSASVIGPYSVACLGALMTLAALLIEYANNGFDGYVRTQGVVVGITAIVSAAVVYLASPDDDQTRTSAGKGP